ncbi:hypothetical protein BH23ACT12_BH23ACT12_08240 [soil metagenome]
MRSFRNSREQQLDRVLSGARVEAGNLEDISRLVRKVQSDYLDCIEPELETRHIAALMQVVHLTDKGDLAARPASKVIGPARQASGLPRRSRRFVLESFFATLTAKLALGGVAVAMAATGGMAATGNLPDKSQTAIARAVDNVGIELPLGDTAKKAAEAAERAEQAAAEALERARAAADTETDASAAVTPGAPNANAEFGQDVATDAREQAEERREAGQANRPGDIEPPPASGQLPPPGPSAAAGDTPGGGQIPSSLPGGKPADVGGRRP